MKTGHVLLVAYGVVLTMGVVFGALSVIELKGTTARLEHVVSDSAQTVIEVERLRAASDRFGLTVRSYLLTQSARFRSASDEAGAEYRERLQALSERLRGSPSESLLDQLREIDARGKRGLDDIFSRRLSPEESVLLVEQRGQPLREQLDAVLEELSRREGLALREATHDASLATTQTTARLSGLAVIALAVAFAVTVALVRTLRLLAESRKDLERSIQSLENINRDLDAFVGRTAHDLRNVIAPLGLMADILEQKANDPAALQRFAERLKRIGRTASSLIESYLTFARATHPATEQDSASVQRVLADVMEDLGPIATEKRARLEVGGDDVAVRCSPSLLHTTLMNLVGNGLKFLDGGVRREVCVTVLAWPDRCEIRVKDGGSGIPAGAEEKIFAPFYRIPGVEAPGTGIGLATVARIVNAYGGQLSVESAPGQGSTFSVSLPRADTL